MSDQVAEPVAPVADLPSGEPIPPPSAAAALEPITSIDEKKPQPSPAALTKALHASDAFLARLNKCLSTPTGIDTVLLLLCYTSKFSASILGVLSRSILQRSLREWLAVIAGSVPQGATTAVVVDSKTAAAVAPAAARALVHAKRLNALSTLLSEARTMTRLWALVGISLRSRKRPSPSCSFPSASRCRSSRTAPTCRPRACWAGNPRASARPTCGAQGSGPRTWALRSDGSWRWSPRRRGRRIAGGVT
ncbi:hypothetical protein SMACR_00091 [Sordaria macrospora]|uniref:Uncharacterized protein n=1 Tax=Sordaria macrospora TaxID=5147 RepID=A0A8S8ZTL8_SORMA|nr:hypothetical protein SMACR_00091 [Sordaria macrospora]